MSNKRKRAFANFGSVIGGGTKDNPTIKESEKTSINYRRRKKKKKDSEAS